jgi:hypothetical protein
MSYLHHSKPGLAFVSRLARLTAGALLAPAMILGISTATAGAATGCSAPAALSSMSATSQSSCWEPFTASSPVNTELPAYPKLASNNAAVQQHMATYNWSLQGGNSGFSLSDNGTRPVYYASASDPVMTVNCTDEDGPNTCQGYNGIEVNGATIHVPAGAQAGNNWDAHMTVIETATGQEYDFWHTSISGSTLTAGSGSVENVNTSDGTQDAGDAASLALTAGLLRPSELASGHIDHALAIDIPCTNATGANVGYSWPATGGWGQYCGQYWNESTTGAPNIGQLFKLNMTDAQIAASRAPQWQQAIMTALAHYGAYAEDTNGSWHDEGIYIFTQDPTSWTSLGKANPWTSVINSLGGQNGTLSSTIPIPTSKLQVVDPCVPQRACPNASSNQPTQTNKHSSKLHAGIASVKKPRKSSRHSASASHRVRHVNAGRHGASTRSKRSGTRKHRQPARRRSSSRHTRRLK